MISETPSATYAYYFENIKPKPQKKPSVVYKCLLCGYEYNESVQKVPFSELPSDWTCPLCGADKSTFALAQNAPNKETTSKKVYVCTICGYEYDENVEKERRDEIERKEAILAEEEKVLDSVRYGCIQNVDIVCNAVSQVVSRLEQEPSIAPRKIKSVYISVGGRSLSSVIVDESTTLPDETEITEYIIEQIKYKVKTTAIADRDVIDVVPCKYFVDKQMVPNPVGVFGQTLTAKMNLIVCKPQIKRNINRVLCERLPYAIAGYIVRPVAIADIVLTDNEKRLGCMFVDFGAETTTVSIYKDAVLQYIATLPMGSRNITRDITATNCIEEKAEEIKKNTKLSLTIEEKRVEYAPTKLWLRKAGSKETRRRQLSRLVMQTSVPS